MFVSLIQCCDLGYHASLHRALRTYLSAEFNVETSKHGGLETIENAAENLEAQADKQRLMETYNNTFCPPIRFDFQSHMGDQVNLHARSCVFESVARCSFLSGCWNVLACICMCVRISAKKCNSGVGVRLAQILYSSTNNSFVTSKRVECLNPSILIMLIIYPSCSCKQTTA